MEILFQHKIYVRPSPRVFQTNFELGAYGPMGEGEVIRRIMEKDPEEKFVAFVAKFHQTGGRGQVGENERKM